MAISLVTLLDTFLTWMNKTNETITVANLATSGQLNTTGTITITNAGGLNGGVSLNVASGVIKGDGGLLSNLNVSTTNIKNNQLANDNIKFASNTLSLKVTVSGPANNANLGTTVYFGMNVSNDINDTSILNIASANIVNVTYVLARSAYNVANSGTSSAAAFDKANSANVLAKGAYDMANSANVLAKGAYDMANTSNVLAKGAYDASNTVYNSIGGYFKGNRGGTGHTSGKSDIFRINNNYLNANVTINTGENAIAVGPLSVNSGIVLMISSGGRAVIV